MATTDLPLEKLGAYLEQHVSGFLALNTAKKFSGGQSNPTYLLSADSGQYVLRRKPFGELLKSAHAVEREFRVIRALRNSEVPVPEALHLCTDKSVAGSVFFLMSYVPGRIFWDPALPELDAEQRAAIYDDMNRILVALHAVDVNATGLADYGRPGNYFARQVSRWTKQYRASETETIAAMDKLIDWLPANLPPDDGRVSLIHGDYRLDNFLFDEHRESAVALLDWELSTLGHPFADLAYQCMQLRMPSDALIKGLADLDRRSLGIPTEREYVTRYCERAGLTEIPDWTFYLVFSFFRLAAILQGVLKRALDGNASNKQAVEYGAMTSPLAGMALELLDD